jgi:REP element-mobilizing transposase RayT
MKQGVKHTIKEDKSYYLTLTVVGWADVFTRLNHKKTIIDSLKYCQQNKGLNIYAYCLMTNHLHMIANTNDPFLLKDTIRDFKRHTSQKIVEQRQEEPESRREWLMSLFAMGALNSSKHKEYRFWQEGNHAIELYSHSFTWDKINYIHQNPVRAGFVKKPEDWLYSSATNYNDMESVLDVVLVAHRLITYS